MNVPLAESFRVRLGSVIGVKHKKKGLNNQDYQTFRWLEIDGRQYGVGILADGMTGEQKLQSSNEVGARLLSEFALSEIGLLLASNIPAAQVPHALYPRAVAYVGNIARATRIGPPQAMWEFIERFMLSSLVGFILSEDMLVHFRAGDGLSIVNGKVHIVNQNNKPLYLAYHVLDRLELESKGIQLPESFEVETFAHPEFSRFAIGSDGLIQEKPGTTEAWVPPEDVDALWNYEPSAPAGLKWWLNKQQLAARFSDDTTLITLEQLQKGGVPCA